MKNKKELLKEDLKRFNSLMGYDESKGLMTEKVGPDRSVYHQGKEQLNEEDPEEEGNEEFDFGGEEGGDAEGGEEGAGNDEFDFGDEEMTADEMGGEAEGGEEPMDLGKEDEFSAADELESEEEVEEIDVTDIVNKSEEAAEVAQQAASTAQQNTSYLETLTSKFDSLENSLNKMDNILAKISKIESDIKTPEEKLELRSLESYPYNQTLTDYWSVKAGENDNYDISGGETTSDKGTKVYKISLDDVQDYTEDDIKNSFNPEI
jgi:hypothetical protein